jgi:hypothetical protein
MRAGQERQDPFVDLNWILALLPVSACAYDFKLRAADQGMSIPGIFDGHANVVGSVDD